MTARPLAPVIPSSAVPAARQRARSAAGRSLPLARPVPVPSLPQDVIYRIGRTDASGRVADQGILAALGWQVGDLLTMTAAAGVVTARRDPGGMVPVPERACLVIPAALRRRCGLEPGDQVLLAGAPADDTLTAYCLAVVHEAIRAREQFPHTHGGQP